MMKRRKQQGRVYMDETKIKTVASVRKEITERDPIPASSPPTTATLSYLFGLLRLAHRPAHAFAYALSFDRTCNM